MPTSSKKGAKARGRSNQRSSDRSNRTITSASLPGTARRSAREPNRYTALTSGRAVTNRRAAAPSRRNASSRLSQNTCTEPKDFLSTTDGILCIPPAVIPHGRALIPAVRVPSRYVEAVKDMARGEQGLRDGYALAERTQQLSHRMAPGVSTQLLIHGLYGLLRRLVCSEAGPLKKPPLHRPTGAIQISRCLSHPVRAALRHADSPVRPSGCGKWIAGYRVDTVSSPRTGRRRRPVHGALAAVPQRSAIRGPVPARCVAPCPPGASWGREEGVAKVSGPRGYPVPGCPRAGLSSSPRCPVSRLPRPGRLRRWRRRRARQPSLHRGGGVPRSDRCRGRAGGRPPSGTGPAQGKATTGFSEPVPQAAGAGDRSASAASGLYGNLPRRRRASATRPRART
jgi:hypothetical protein